jgi:Flp pilus assembly protein TadD
MINYKKNISIIESYNQEMAKKIDEAKQPDYIKILKARNKQENFLYKHGSSFFAAYDMNNPNKVIRTILKKEEFHKDKGSILIGAGLGHYVYEFCRHKQKEHRLIVLEPYPWFIKKTFENYDLSKWFSNGTLMFVGREMDLNYAVGAIDTIAVIQGWNVICSNYAYNRPNEYGSYIEYANGLVNQLHCNIGTVMGAGPQIAKNDIMNLPYIIRHRGVNILKDVFKGCPAVIVSTGPSLEKNVFHLKKMGSRVIIIAVAQALRVLLAYDIKPDFICTVDYGKVNEDHFKGLYDCNVPLVALNRTYAPILKKWKGTKYIVSSQPEIQEFKDTVTGIIAQKGSLAQGGSVSHMAFSLGMHMGCDPLILIGQDLGYPDDKSHIPLADASGKIIEKDGRLEWDIKDGRSSLGKQKYLMSNTVMAHGYYGGFVRTNRGLASFIITFERIIADLKDSKIVINATEGGARIKGALQYTLREAIEKYAKFNINKKRIKNYSGLVENSDKIIKAVIPLLDYEIDIMKEVAGNAKKGLKTVEEMKKLNKGKENKEEIQELLKQNKEHSVKAQEKAQKLPLLGLMIYHESRLIQNKELKVTGKIRHVLKNRDDLEIRLNRNKIILTAAKKACEELIGLYKKTKQILQDHLNGKDVLTSKEKYIPDISDAEEMFDAGNWGRPLLEAQQLLKMKGLEQFDINRANSTIEIAKQMRKESIERNKKENVDNSQLIRYFRYIEKARKKGQKAEFQEALTLLKEAVALFPDREEGLWGYATILHHCKRIQEALKQYKKLMEIAPDNLQYKFEYGQVLMREDIQAGMKVIGEVMAKTEEFDHFLVRVGDLYFEKGMYDQAIIAYENFHKKYPPDPGSLTNLAKSYTMIGKKRLADKLIRKYKAWVK